VQKTSELIAGCGCDQGCPSCVGPAGELATRSKEAALAILDLLNGSMEHQEKET
jgi:DEAD/DEAH box helicase domain-containing protein